MAWALITAAGASSRMGGGTKKEYRILDGRPVIAHSVAVFLATNLFAGVALTVPPGGIEEARSLLRAEMTGGFLHLTEGGSNRQESVLRGLRLCAAFAPDIVLVHDGARPWISPGLIRAVYEGVLRQDACIPVLPATEAMKHIDTTGYILAHLERSSIAAAQTPQGFRFERLLAAHEAAARDGRSYVDDAEVWARYEGAVATVPGEAANRKITYPVDLPALEDRP